jgi:hypothetical protein
LNTNLIHNILNVAIGIVGGLAAVDWSIITPTRAGLIVAILAGTKTLINVFRDGISGLAKPQPPVQ